MKAKFEVIISDIDEDQLGPMLGKMPDNLTIGIKLMQRAEITKAATTTPAARKAPPFAALPNGRRATVEQMIAAMPQQFQAKDFVPVIEAAGFNGNSITHFLRMAMDRKLIEKIPGLFGNKSAYRKK